MQKLLHELEPEYRLPLILRYWEDYSYEDIRGDDGDYCGGCETGFGVVTHCGRQMERERR